MQLLHPVKCQNFRRADIFLIIDSAADLFFPRFKLTVRRKEKRTVASVVQPGDVPDSQGTESDSGSIQS